MLAKVCTHVHVYLIHARLVMSRLSHNYCWTAPGVDVLLVDFAKSPPCFLRVLAVQLACTGSCTAASPGRMFCEVLVRARGSV